nr:myb-like protein AA [Megalopta genalis]
MSRNCCNFAVPLMAIFLVIACTTPLQYPIVVDDYGYNDYQNYEQPRAKQNRQYSKQDQLNYEQPRVKQNRQYAKQDESYANYEQPYTKQDQQYTKQDESYANYEQPYTKQYQQYPKQDQSYANYDQSYIKQDQSYANYEQPYEKQDQQYAKQNQQYGNQDQTYANYEQPYEKQDQQYAKQNQQYAKQNQQYGNQDQSNANYEQLYTKQDQRYTKYEPVYSKFDRPIVVKPQKPKDGSDFSKIPGTPGVDYPVYHTIPRTSFSCAYVPFAPGMYANVETGCQVYHICHDGREGHQGASFLCPNGTIFSQREFSCDWWHNVKCAEAIALYSLNLDPEKNPYLPKKKKEEPQKNMRIVVL